MPSETPPSGNAWAIREDRLASAYAFGGASYIAVVVGLGLFGLGALLLGVQPVVPPGADTPDNNTLLPVMLEQIAPAALAIPFLFLLLGALFSTADSDVNALASIAMTDLWRDRLRPQAGHRELVLVGRATMLLAVVLGLAVAMLRLDILAMILFVGMVRAAAVFPVAATLMRWPVNGLGFGLGIVIGAAAGVTTYFLTADGAAALDAAPRAATLLGAVAATGPGVLALCLLAPYLGRWALLPATLAGLATLPFAAGVVEYQFLASSMVSLGVAGVACAAVSAATRSDASFDWSRLRSIPALGAAHPTPKPAAAEPPA